jgi:hypothetical protein
MTFIELFSQIIATNHETPRTNARFEKLSEHLIEMKIRNRLNNGAKSLRHFFERKSSSAVGELVPLPVAVTVIGKEPKGRVVRIRENT